MTASLTALKLIVFDTFRIESLDVMHHFLVSGGCQPSQAPDRPRGEKWILKLSSGK